MSRVRVPSIPPLINSGMSAKETALFESAQALFCSIADKLGSAKSKKILNKDQFPTFSDFQNANQKLIDDALKQVDIDVGIVNVYNYLGGYDPKDSKKTFKTTPKGTSWYHSSLSIANKIVESLDSVTGFKKFKLSAPTYESKMFYYRGDKEVMAKIGELFSIAKGSKVSKEGFKDSIVEIKDINKWNPADIYFANATAKKLIGDELNRARKLKKTYTFIGGGKIKAEPEEGDGLNIFIARLIDQGVLLPLSLKKAKDSVTLKPVNFSRDVKEAILSSIKYVKKTDWKPYQKVSSSGFLIEGTATTDKNKLTSWLYYSGLNAKKIVRKTSTRDIVLKITLENPNKVEGGIKFRHDPSGKSGGRFLAEFIFKGASAKGGSVASAKLISDIWSNVDSEAASKFITAYNLGAAKFKAIKSAISDEDKDNLRMFKTTWNAKVSQYDHYMAIASGEEVTNKVIPILRDWFDNAEEHDKQKFVMLMFQIVTSRSPLSSKFLIAK
jgi:hypothetical protein